MKLEVFELFLCSIGNLLCLLSSLILRKLLGLYVDRLLARFVGDPLLHVGADLRLFRLRWRYSSLRVRGVLTCLARSLNGLYSAGRRQRRHFRRNRRHRWQDGRRNRGGAHVAIANDFRWAFN